MPSFGPDSVVLPVGNTSNRPGSPSAGLVRYNSDESAVEFYSGTSWKVSKAPLGTYENPATSGQAIYNSGQTASGVYWLKTPGGTPFEAYIKMDYGGGWINLNRNLGPYTNVLTSSYGSGGSDILTGASGFDTTALNCGSSTQAQASSFGCGGSSGQAYVSLNSTFASNFGITQARIKLIYVSDDGNVVCGPYFSNSLSSRTIITGTSIQVEGTCNNPPNRYSDLVGEGFTIEWYGTLISTSIILYAYTACGGSFNMQLREVYVR
jgi:hypothetical protein